MGVYASNVYDLTIPMLAIGPVMAEHKEMTAHRWGEAWPTEWDAHTPEALVDMIAREAGADDSDGVEAVIDGGDLRITGYSFGKVGEIDSLGIVLATNNATGIIHGECEGEHFLTELADGTVKQHIGHIVFPSYTGTLYHS